MNTGILSLCFINSDNKLFMIEMGADFNCADRGIEHDGSQKSGKDECRVHTTCADTIRMFVCVCVFQHIKAA